MAHRLIPDERESVLWQDQVTVPPGSPGMLPDAADVVVIGAGYCGLAAAHDLARAGRSVVVLERDALGRGASTRNGGMVIPELKAGPAALERTYGSLGTRLYGAVQEAFDLVESLADGGPVRCDYERTGQLYLAHHPRVVPKLAAIAAEHVAHGEDVRFLDAEEVRAEVGSELFPGGVLYARTGGLHPARFHAGLLERALDAGAFVRGRTPALGVRRERHRLLVETDAGPIQARQVIAATNATADDALAELRSLTLPVGSFIIATEPLDPGLAASVIPHRRMLVDSKNLLFYWRRTPDDRIAFGGRRSLRRTTLRQARTYLHDAMVRIHPQLAGVAVTHAWGGEVALTLDRLPHVGHVGDVLYATGCNGSGVALNTWLGTRLAGMLLGEEPPPFAQIPHRRVPLWRARRLWLPLAGLAFRWQDRGFPHAGGSAADRAG